MLDRTLVTESKEYDCLESYLLALHLVSLLGLSHHDVASMKLQFLEKKSQLSRMIRISTLNLPFPSASIAPELRTPSPVILS
jgi:hypothetical protein